MINHEIAYINGIPQKLVVFLHGYQDCAEHIERKVAALREIPNLALHIPQAPFVNEVDDTKRQWYSIHQFDPDDKRRQAASLEEFVEFYNKMTLGLEEANHYILEYVDNLLNEYGLGYEDLFLCGFSQGAMCALYSSLMCPYKIAGVVSLSGILAAKGYLEKHYQSQPDCLLIHGREDDKIRFKALDFTVDGLRQMGCLVETYAVENTGHRIMPEEIDETCRFIKARFL